MDGGCFRKWRGCVDVHGSRTGAEESEEGRVCCGKGQYVSGPISEPRLARCFLLFFVSHLLFSTLHALLALVTLRGSLQFFGSGDVWLVRLGREPLFRGNKFVDSPLGLCIRRQLSRLVLRCFAVFKVLDQTENSFDDS